VPKIVTNSSDEKSDKYPDSIDGKPTKTEYNESADDTQQEPKIDEDHEETIDYIVKSTIDHIIDIIETVDYAIGYVDDPTYLEIEQTFEYKVREPEKLNTNLNFDETSYKSIQISNNSNNYDNLIENCVQQLKILLKLFVCHHIFEERTNSLKLNYFFAQFFHSSQGE
jgi:hypothetical protein